MTRTYRYPLRPTKAQAATLESWLAFCCQLYNAALEHRIGAWRRGRASVNRLDQQKELAELRAADAEAASVPSDVARSALHRLDRAFQAFFRRCKSGDLPGFPRFRGRDWYDSFSFRTARIDGNRVYVPKLGPVRFHRYRELEGTVREVTIRRSCGRWYVSFACELGEAPDKVPVRTSTGIDLGLTTFAVTSEGERFANPQYFRRGKEHLAFRHRRLSRRRRGSNGRQRARLLVAKAHERIKNQRLDFARKLAVELVERYDLIAVEDLNVRDLMQKSNLNRSIADAAWRIFLTCLSLKAEKAGATVVEVDPRGTSQRCSGCGETVKKTLWDRVHSCPCGLVLDRDHNAAINILNLGYSPGRGEAVAMSAEVLGPIRPEDATLILPLLCRPARPELPT